jgi:hypothetical protein
MGPRQLPKTLDLIWSMLLSLVISVLKTTSYLCLGKKVLPISKKTPKKKKNRLLGNLISWKYKLVFHIA